MRYLILFILSGCQLNAVDDLGILPQPITQSKVRVYIMLGQSNCGYYSPCAFNNYYVKGVKAFDSQDKNIVDSLSAYQMPGNKFSPLILLAGKLKGMYPNDNLFFFQFHRSGTNLYSDWNINNNKSTSLYKQSTAQLDLLFSQIPKPDHVTLIWLQGESDSGRLEYAEGYQKNEADLFNALIDRFNVDTIIDYIPYASGKYLNVVIDAKSKNHGLMVGIPVKLNGLDKTYNGPHMTVRGIKMLVNEIKEKL